MKRKLTKEEQLNDYREQIRERIERWETLRKAGCSDPFWCDGSNLNLVRNHIIYNKGKVMEICEELGLPLPEEYYFPIPPKLPKDFMVNLKQTERVKRLRQFGCRIVTKAPNYDNTQLSLF